MPAKEISSTKKLRGEQLKLSKKVRSDLNELRSELRKLSKEVARVRGAAQTEWVQRSEELRNELGSALKRSKELRSKLLKPRIDDDDAPGWTKEDFARVDLYHGNKLIRRGRPPSDNPKQALKLRIDPDVVEHFRATGPGWQTRINAALRRAAKLPMRKAG